jgi:hypothetical protein
MHFFAPVLRTGYELELRLDSEGSIEKEEPANTGENTYLFAFVHKRKYIIE